MSKHRHPVCVVADDDNVREVVRDLLESEGHDVQAFGWRTALRRVAWTSALQIPACRCHCASTRRRSRMAAAGRSRPLPVIRAS